MFSHGLYIPDALELQVMYRHYRLDATVEFIVAETDPSGKQAPDLSASHGSG